MPVNDTSPLVIDFVGLHVSEALKQELTFTSPSSRQGYRMGRETSVSIEGFTDKLSNGSSGPKFLIMRR